MLLKLQWFDIFQKNNACYFELNKLPHEGHGRPHTKQKASAGRCVYCHFTVPMSAVQRRRESMFICTAHSCWQWWPFKKSLSQKLTMPFRKKKNLSLWQLSYWNLLSDIHTMSQRRTATKNTSHLISFILAATRSLSQDETLWHLGLLWSGLVWLALITLTTMCQSRFTCINAQAT